MVRMIKSLLLALAALSGLTALMLCAAALLFAVPVISLLQGAQSPLKPLGKPASANPPLTIEGDYYVVSTA